MNLQLKWRLLLLFAIALLFGMAQITRAQDTTPMKRLRSPATVTGEIGGESTDRYVIRARKGQSMTVQFSWKKEDDNTASFAVSHASGDDPIPGKESAGGKRWTGRISKTGDYIISVNAHPSANYRLRVILR